MSAPDPNTFVMSQLRWLRERQERLMNLAKKRQLDTAEANELQDIIESIDRIKRTHK